MPARTERLRECAELHADIGGGIRQVRVGGADGHVRPQADQHAIGFHALEGRGDLLRLALAAGPLQIADGAKIGYELGRRAQARGQRRARSRRRARAARTAAPAARAG